MKVFLYWLARLGLFVAVLAILWFVLRWQDVIAFVAAFIVAWLIGYLALPKMRREAAEQMDGWISRSQRSLRDADAEEDEEVSGAFSERGKARPEPDED